MAVIALPSRCKAFGSMVTVTSVGLGCRLVAATMKLRPGVLYSEVPRPAVFGQGLHRSGLEAERVTLGLRNADVPAGVVWYTAPVMPR